VRDPEIIRSLGAETTCCGEALSLVGRGGYRGGVEVRRCPVCESWQTFARLPSWGRAQEQYVLKCKREIIARAYRL
jgi:hypothetical protein